jgi:nucleoside-triphosphatase THEP1
MRTSDDTMARIIDAITARRGCVIVHGGIGAGKTRRAERLVTELRERGVAVGGIISPRILDGDDTIGYRARDIETGEERLLAGVDPPGVRVGMFYLSEQALAFARTAIERASGTKRVVLLDEVGRLELEDKGHAQALRTLLRSGAVPVLFVRSKFVEAVVEEFAIVDYVSFPA